MVKIAFWDNILGERGTTVALYDYAYYNQSILNNTSIILYDSTDTRNNQNVVEKFKKQFVVYGTTHFDQVDKILLDTKCDIFYIIKYGTNDHKVSKIIRTVVHCVFSCAEPHGNIYSAISSIVPHNNGKYPIVPHMINLPDHDRNMRSQLKIPTGAIVYGRHGGYDQFDIKYVQDVVSIVAKYYSHIYFIFMNTKPFCESLPNIIHLSTTVSLEEKVAFINTCDAMLWARSDGETFGLSIGEFSSKNKPIVCTEIGSLGHKIMLKETALWYDQNTLFKILTTFDKKNMAKKDWNMYKEYTPENVMKIFKKVYIPVD